MRAIATGVLVLAMLAPVPPAAATQKYAKPPAHSGSGRRIVYSEKLQHVWLINRNEQVVKHYRVTGRADWPRVGTYKVFSHSRATLSWDKRFRMEWMTRFVHSTNANIGFHSIPTTLSGRPIQTEEQLGLPLGIGGCVRLSYYGAKYLYDWAHNGTPVVVVR